MKKQTKQNTTNTNAIKQNKNTKQASKQESKQASNQASKQASTQPKQTNRTSTQNK